MLLCGHYEGVDQRAHRRSAWTRSCRMGDFVLTGGELAAHGRGATRWPG